ncbi:MAG: DoxX family protein [Bacteroidota bacterium]
MLDHKNLDLSLLLLRICFGGMMLVLHGLPKLEKLLWGDPSAFPDPIGLGAYLSLCLAVFAEALCATLVVFGLFTRVALIPLIVTMLVAMLIVQGGKPMDDKELALLYLIPYLVLLLAGPGFYSLDARLRHIQ